MTEAKKKAVKKKVITNVEKPKGAEKAVAFEFPGRAAVVAMIGAENALEVDGLVKKFHQRYGCKLRYVDKFKSFKIFKAERHMDWIDLNELMKRYDCRIPPVSRPLQAAQRPYDNNKKVY
jgi:hypothetical protein